MQFRFVKAYVTTFVVIFSYLRVSLLSKLLGDAYRERELARLHRRNARRIERTIVQLQGLFIKVGQLISIMTNFLPEEFRKPLETLQDAVPPRPFGEIRARIEEELGAPPETLFASFDEVPLASASLGQAHRARLRDGTEVVVKVQHSDIDTIVRMDLVTIWRIMLIVRLFVPIRGLDLIYRQVREMILAELDFEREAESMELIGEGLDKADRVVVPTLYREFCTGRVLTSEFCDGAKISDLDQLDEWKVDRGDLARRLVRAYCKMIFVDGHYHADPHPGNVLVRADGTIVLLDFGAVAELSATMRKGIPDVIVALIKRDTPGIQRALRTMGFIAHGADADAVAERIIEYFHQRFQEEVKLESLNLKDIKIDPERGIEKLLDFKQMDFSLRELTSTFRVPKDWVLLERTVLLLSGVCTHLEPEMNPIAVIRPYLEEFVLGEDRDFATLVMNAVKDTAMSALALPEDVRKYLGKAGRGELEMKLRGVHESAGLLYALGHQLIYALFTLLGLAFGAVFYMQRDLIAMLVSFGLAGFFGLLVLGSMLLARARKR